MSGAQPLFDFFLYIRRGPSPIRAGSLAEAIQAAARMPHLEPFKITDGQSNVLLDEFVFRWNRRRSTRLAFDTLLGMAARLSHFSMRDFVPRPAR